MNDGSQAVSIPGLTLSSEIREGGQAQVIRATTTDGNCVAVKVSRHEPAARRALENEGEALQRIHASDPTAHEWLVPLFRRGLLPDGRPYMVQPWLPHSLLSWLAANEPPLADRIDALVQATAAVARLHETGSLDELWVHRDLKPANFLVSTEPKLQLRLADLGTLKARTFRAQTHNTVLFTPVYAPPEQRLPLDRPLDPSVDVHALGVMTFQVLTGSLPQTATQRTGYRLPAGDELLALQSSEDALPEARRARLRHLRIQPLSRFYDLTAAPDLLASDRRMLRDVLRGAFPRPLANTLLASLIPPLSRALRADPERRASSARELLAALVHCRSQLGAAPHTVAHRLAAKVLTSAPRSGLGGVFPKRVRTPVLVAGGVLAGATLTLGTLWALWPSTEALTAEEAAAMGMEPTLARAKLSVRYTGDPKATIVFEGLKSTGTRLPAQPLVPGRHTVWVQSTTGRMVGELSLIVTPQENGWVVVTESLRGSARTGPRTWTLDPGQTLPLVLAPNGTITRSTLPGQ